jgi:hypothetical protein
MVVIKNSNRRSVDAKFNQRRHDILTVGDRSMSPGNRRGAWNAVMKK